MACEPVECRGPLRQRARRLAWRSERRLRSTFAGCALGETELVLQA